MIDKLINEIIRDWSRVPFEDMEKWLNDLRRKYNGDAQGNTGG
jgi:hypothetical protein